jgi:DNA modification methylase
VISSSIPSPVPERFGVVALRLGRSFLGIELNPVYVEMAERRIHNQAGLFSVMDPAIHIGGRR